MLYNLIISSKNNKNLFSWLIAQPTFGYRVSNILLSILIIVVFTEADLEVWIYRKESTNSSFKISQNT